MTECVLAHSRHHHHLAAHAEDGRVARHHEQVSPGQTRPVPQLGGLQQRPGLSSVHNNTIIVIILVPSTNCSSLLLRSHLTLSRLVLSAQLYCTVLYCTVLYCTVLCSGPTSPCPGWCCLASSSRARTSALPRPRRRGRQTPWPSADNHWHSSNSADYECSRKQYQGQYIPGVAPV